MGEKDLKAHLDLSPEAGPVAEVRFPGQQNTEILSVRGSPAPRLSPGGRRLRDKEKPPGPYGCAADSCRAQSRTRPSAFQSDPGDFARFWVVLLLPLPALPLPRKRYCRTCVSNLTCPGRASPRASTFSALSLSESRQALTSPDPGHPKAGPGGSCRVSGPVHL